MVRVTRFSFDDGMRIDYPIPRESFDDDDEDVVNENEQEHSKAPPASRGRSRRSNPTKQKSDRRHLAGADWMAAPPEQRAERDRNPPEETQEKTGADL